MSGRARSHVDAGRLAAAASRPGIDPRMWIVQATITQLGFDADNGLFADVSVIPTGENETCMIGGMFCGDGEGFYGPLKVGDVVIVAVPSGDPDAGPVIISRIWSAVRKPPADAGSGDEPTQDVLLRVRNGRSVKIVAEGGGSVATIMGESGGSVSISTTGSAPVSITSASAVIVNAPSVQLGNSASMAVARMGDVCQVTLPPITVTALPGGDPCLVLVGALPGATPNTLVGQIITGKDGVMA